MRNYTFRKQTQQDFQQRVKRIDPHYHAHGSAKRTAQRPSRPVLSLLLGFGWATLLVTVARNRSQIEDSLLQGTLPAQYHDYVFYMLAGLLAISAVLLAGPPRPLHRAARRAPRRRNSGGLLAGAAAAAVLAYTPADVFDTGLGLLHENSGTLIQAAAGSANVDLASITFVSSNSLN